MTNDRGEFQLININNDDTIKITNVAYYSKLIAVKALEKTDTIFLDEDIKELNEVIIRNIGSYKFDKDLGFLEFPNNAEFKLMPGSQMAIFIENPVKQEAWIKEVSFKIKQFGSCKNNIRIRLLQVDTLDNLPSIDLLTENLILKYSRLKKVNHVDVSKHKIILPSKGVFIVIEWVDLEGNCSKNSYTSISANMSFPKNLVWLNFHDKLWGHSNRPRLNNGNYMTPNISLKVAY